jgi:hypothetical protein
MALSASMQITDQDARTPSTTKGSQRYGQTAATSDGRLFAYTANGSASLALAPGKLAQGAVSTANHINRTGVTATVGQQTVTFAVGATAVTANQYQDGYLVVNAGTGAGQALLISGNTSASSSGSPTVNLKDAFTTATAVADSKFILHPNIWSAALIAASASATSVLPVGVPMVSIPASNYGWFQIGGSAAVLANGTPALGSGVIPSATTDGAVDVELAASVTARVGIMMVTAVSTEYRPVFLTIGA